MPFETEEERDDPEQADAVRSSFEQLRQQADPANLKYEERDGRKLIWIEPPYAAEQQHQERLAEHAALERVLRLYLWATKAIENGQPEASITLKQAFDEMVALDEPELFDIGETLQDMRRHHTQSAVSGAAAVIANHADDELWERAADAVAGVIERAATMPEVMEDHSWRGMHLTGHPPAMAAYGYAALLRRDPVNADYISAIFQLAVDPMKKVVEAVYTSALIFSDVAPDMIWRLYCLATQRAARSHAYERGPHWSGQEAEEQSVLAEEAERLMVEDALPVPHRRPQCLAADRAATCTAGTTRPTPSASPIKRCWGTSTRTALLNDAGASIDWMLASFSREMQRSERPSSGGMSSAAGSAGS